MKKNNFTDNQISLLVKAISPKLNVRINRAGNITVTNTNRTDNSFWTLYKLGLGNYIWRKHDGFGSCFPLHMTGRTRVGEIHTETYNGHKFVWYNRNYNIKNSEFNTFEDAVNYFIYYLKKYRKIAV